MPKPDFIVIGAMKCATSTVCAYLEDHPEVFMVANGEPRFFSHDEHFARGYSWYESLFEGKRNERICGEGSNDYAAGALYPEAAARMAAYHPTLKLIYMVRHPLDRMSSAWIQDRSVLGDKVGATLDAAVTTWPERYIDQSLYWKNLQRYRACYPDDQIFIGFMEDLATDRDAFFARLTSFLGVSASQTIQRSHMNASQGKRIPSPAYTFVNRLPFVATLKRAVPKSLRRAVKERMLSRSVDGKPAFSSSVLAHIMPVVQQDAAAFLGHCGRDPRLWNLDAAGHRGKPL